MFLIGLTKKRERKRDVQLTTYTYIICLMNLSMTYRGMYTYSRFWVKESVFFVYSVYILCICMYLYNMPWDLISGISKYIHTQLNTRDREKIWWWWWWYGHISTLFFFLSIWYITKLKRLSTMWLKTVHLILPGGKSRVIFLGPCSAGTL